MKAVVYNGPKDVSVNTIDDPKIEKQTDVIIRLTTTNICGSDLHMYESRIRKFLNFDRALRFCA
ncbi:alcohol dehydrogenase catalytic domain-containing protein [Sphingobium sp.]|uniref:alcohol dehydrogenase catalytic domain-containing protein n=1 Tax=Sphingobium sp. TaxID=1912891 RepID=UPI002580F57B|nr:alcohol dehydrogenase catalytic domain-containing protein [Sphingobium sp.]